MSDQSWKKTDTNDPTYKRNYIIVAVTTSLIGLVAGLILATKIDAAEKANRASLDRIKAEKAAKQH